MPPKNKDPNKPKGRTSAYGFFMQEKREVYRQKNVEVQFTPFSRECAAEWKDMEKEDKEKFMAQAEEDRIRYENEMASYTPPEEYRTGKGEGRRKKKQKDPNLPKRAMTGFLYFSQDKRPKLIEQSPGSRVGDIAKKLGAAWKVMTDSQKKPYEDKAKLDRQRYESEMELYRKGEFVRNEAPEEEDSENED